MGIPLLTTKFYIPPLRDNYVPRTRLLEQLNSNLDRKLILISAPAGFGKTTLLCEWLASAGARQGLQVGWLSLDSGDNEPDRFWAYFLRALPGNHPGRTALQMLDSAEQIPIQNILTVLLNDIALQDLPLVVILDDYHCIDSPTIQNSLWFLIEHAPPQFHIILATRIDPPWPLARLRSREEILEIRQVDLRFSFDESSAFLNTVMQLNLIAEDIQILDARAEGWITALQMAAISLQNCIDPSNFIHSFTGNHRFVLDYLLEEVLNRQPGNVREFLLKTSILERLSIPLCNFVAECDNSQSILFLLEKRNLFLTSLDDQRRWFRYHHLFADLLRNQLAQNHADLIPTLHRRASQWHQGQGQIFEAVRYALTAFDYNLAADLIEQNLIAFKDHGELPAVMNWLGAFPEDFVNARPWLCIAKGWVQAYLGEPDAVKSLLETAENEISKQGKIPSNQHIMGHIAAIRGYLALFDAELIASTKYGYQALELLPENDIQTRISTATTLASALRLNGNLTEAGQILAKAISWNRKTGSSAVTIRLLCAQAALLYTQGRLNQAIECLEEAINSAKIIEPNGELRYLSAVGHAYIRLANFQAIQYRLELALNNIKIGIQLSEQWGQANALWEGYRIEAGIRAALGDLTGASQSMEKSGAASERISGQLALRSSAADQALFRLGEGNVPAAAACIAPLNLHLDDPIVYHQCELYSIWAYVLIAQEKPEQALILLRKIKVVTEMAGAIHLLIGTHILSALAHQKEGAEPQALEALAEAVALAEPAGIAKDFIDDGEALRPLLGKLLSQGKSPAFIGKLLKWITPKYGRKTDDSALIEPLSGRELEVLRLLDTRLDNQQIADQLVISISTVRTHIRNIYAKLGVNRRMEAIHRGRELGLL